MNENSKAIIVLCSRLIKDNTIKPFSTKEWSEVAQRLRLGKKEPKDLFTMSENEMREILLLDSIQVQRIQDLLRKTINVFFRVEEYSSMGINIITRADEDYPSQIKRKLKEKCPPLFYVAGQTKILENKTIGFVGSRSISENDREFTKSMVRKTISNHYGLVSGGAKGIDIVSMETAIKEGGFAIGYVSDSLIKKLKDPVILNAILDEKLILLSPVKPDAGFNAGVAMMRNKFIYAQSDATIVVKSDYNKGGTWSGAVENIRNGWCETLCWDVSGYQGNKELIKMGARPIDENWEFDIKDLPRQSIRMGSDDSIQTDMFNMIQFGNASKASTKDNKE